MSIAILAWLKYGNYYRLHESVYGENKNVMIKYGERIYGKEMS